jgi:hypothetical protein
MAMVFLNTIVIVATDLFVSHGRLTVWISAYLCVLYSKAMRLLLLLLLLLLLYSSHHVNVPSTPFLHCSISRNHQ